MRRIAVMVLGVLCVAMVVGGSGPGELPAVSSPPPSGVDAGEVDASEVGRSAELLDLEPPVVEVARDPAVVRVHDALHWRHTGLSEKEMWTVCEAIVRESRRNDLDPDLVLAVLQVESGGYNFAVSSVGALGLMQLMPPTGREMAESLGIPWHGPDTLFDPVVNVTLGTAYLRQLSDRFGSWPAALAAYNWGPGRIDRRLRRGAGLPEIYARQVLELYEPEGKRSRS